MGLGAFLMAANLNVPYLQIALAGIIPGLLYELALAIGLYSMIKASSHIPYARQTIDWKKILSLAPSFVISFSILIILLYYRYSPSYAAMCGIALIAVLGFLRPRAYRVTIRKLFRGAHEGALCGAKLALILSAIGIAVQMLSTTGLGVLLGQWMIIGSAGNLTIGLILGALISLFIGMGLPTPAAYSLIAIVVVPSLIDLGLSPLVAHFYGFYYAIFSSLTPPVAVAVFTAIRISNGTFRGTVLECLKLAGVCLMLPLLFVQFPTILDWTDATTEMMLSIVLFLLASYMISGLVYRANSERHGLAPRWLLLAGPISFVGFFSTKATWWVFLAFAVFSWVLWTGRSRGRHPILAHGTLSSQDTNRLHTESEGEH